MQNFYRVAHPIEDLVGITDDKYYPRIGIVRPIATLWMVFELGDCLANAGRYVLRAAGRSPSQIFNYSLSVGEGGRYSVPSSVVALVGFGNDIVRNEILAVGLS